MEKVQTYGPVNAQRLVDVRGNEIIVSVLSASCEASGSLCWLRCETLDSRNVVAFLRSREDRPESVRK
jgi:hypothetical protein